MTVAIVALASFEIINAAYGRDTGDTLVAAAKDRIERALSATGEGEVLREGAVFTLALPVTLDAAHPLITAIEFALAQPFLVGGTTVHVGTRIGVASGKGEQAEALVARARAALGEARVLEGATTRIAPPAPDRPIAQLAADLHRAIARDEIAVMFQPQVAFANGRIVGVEALARWRHPELGELGAQILLAASDRADLGIALSDHILSRALASVAEWPDTLAHLRVAVNVTAADLARPDFAARFLTRVDASGVARSRVAAEITEGGLIDDLDSATELLTALRDGGCHVAIDDFGTGYSNLARLKELPVDRVKIDRSLVRDIATSAEARTICSAVVGLIQGLGMEVVIEGIETEAQMEMLRVIGCTLFQGYHLARPMDEQAYLARFAVPLIMQERRIV